jgi:hypothetical protein
VHHAARPEPRRDAAAPAPDAGSNRHRRRDRPEVPLGQPPDLACVDVAGDNQDRVVRGIVRAVEVHRVPPRQPGDLVLRADGRPAIGAARVKGGHELLREGTARVAFHHLPALLDHDFALRENVRLGRSEVDHAIGFHAHHQVEPVRRNALEVGGVVDRGEGVVAPAILRDDPAELTLGELVRGLEHEVLEEMPDA